MKLLVLLALVGLSAAMGVEKAEKEPQVDEIPPVPLVSEVWMVNAVEVPAEKMHKAHCPGGVPAHKACEKDGDCLVGFACLGDEGSKYCCVNEEALQFASCPDPMIPAANKWCSEDSDCGDKAKCIKEFAAPESWVQDRIQAKPELKDYKPEVGICCSDDMDLIPQGVASCPKDQVPFRRGPCGLGIDGCPLGADCWYSEDMMGRCCGSDAKTGASFHYGRYGYGRGYGGYGRGYYGGYGRGYYGGYGRGYYGGYPGHYGYGRHFGYGRK